MKKLTNFIVNKKNYIIVLFIALIAYCIWGMGQVKIEYDISTIEYRYEASPRYYGRGICNVRHDENYATQYLF